jgi:hypothetical protein
MLESSCQLLRCNTSNYGCWHLSSAEHPWLLIILHFRVSCCDIAALRNQVRDLAECNVQTAHVCCVVEWCRLACR